MYNSKTYMYKINIYESTKCKKGGTKFLDLESNTRKKL